MKGKYTKRSPQSLNFFFNLLYVGRGVRCVFATVHIWRSGDSSVDIGSLPLTCGKVGWQAPLPTEPHLPHLLIRMSRTTPFTY